VFEIFVQKNEKKNTTKIEKLKLLVAPFFNIPLGFYYFV